MADTAARPPSFDGTAMQHVRDEPPTVAASAAGAAGDVMQTAKEEARDVAVETRRQLSDLYGQARTEVSEQARVQQRRAVDRLNAVAAEATRVADRGGESGPATDVIREAADRIHRVGRWLDEREPAQLVEDVKTYARRHPGTFLVGAAVLGLMAGRLTRNLAAAKGAMRQSTVDYPTAMAAPSSQRLTQQMTPPPTPITSTGLPTQARP